MCKALEYFEEMKECNQLDYGEEEIKCKAIESNLKFAYDVKRLLAKYDIESLEQLEEILKENNARFIKKCERWLALLESDGINSKNMVATDIQCLLKELKESENT